MKSKLIVGLQIFLVLLSSSLIALGQNETPPKTQETIRVLNLDTKPGGVHKVFETKYVDVETLAEILKVFPCYIKSDQGLRLIGVSCPAEVISSVEDTIKRIDIPAKNIEITVYMLSASEKAGESSGIPPEIQSVIKQLRGVFSYQNYRLLETAVV